MYLLLEYMSETRILYTGPSALRAFRDAVAMVGPNISGYSGVIDLTAGADASATKTKGKTKSKTASKPKFCCWQCGSLEHYVNNKDHPDRTPITKQIKDLILKRVASSSQPANLREAEVKKIKAYWSRHSL